MLPAFASLTDLRARIPGGIEDDDEARAQANLDDASVLIRAESRRNWVNDDDELDLPTGDDRWRADILVRVCLAAAQRAFENPEGVTQEALLSYSETRASSSNDVYLTAAEKRLIRKAAGTSGLGTIDATRSTIASDGRPLGLESERCNEVGADAMFLDTEPAGDPIPWAGPDGY